MGLLVARTAAQVVDFFSLVEWPGPLRSRLISVKSGTCVCALMTLQGKRYIHWAPTQSLCMIHATWNQSERRVVCMDGCMDGCMDRCLSIMAPIALLNRPWKEGSSSRFLPCWLREFFLALWGEGAVVNIWPVKPFETVPVIKVYTNWIELKSQELLSCSKIYTWWNCTEYNNSHRACSELSWNIW